MATNLNMDRINDMVAALERLDGLADKVTGKMAVLGVAVIDTQTVTVPDASKGTLVDTVVSILRENGSPLSNAELVNRVKQAGYQTRTPANLPAIMRSTLTMRADRKTDIVRVGRGVWGLREWKGQKDRTT